VSLRQRTVCKPLGQCLQTIGDWAGLQAGRRRAGRVVEMLSERRLGCMAYSPEIAAHPQCLMWGRAAVFWAPDRCGHARRIRDPLVHPLGEGRGILWLSGGGGRPRRARQRGAAQAGAGDSGGATGNHRGGRAERSSRATTGVMSRSVAWSVVKTTRITRRPVGSSIRAASCRVCKRVSS
jgi:hypothetical protein